MSTSESTRRDGLEKLAVGLIGLPLNLLLLVVLLPLFALVWLLNNSVLLLTGRRIWKGDSRLGFLLFFAQRNLQALTTGRGEFEWTPF